MAHKNLDCSGSKYLHQKYLRFYYFQCPTRKTKSLSKPCSRFLRFFWKFQEMSFVFWIWHVWAWLVASGWRWELLRLLLKADSKSQFWILILSNACFSPPFILIQSWSRHSVQSFGLLTEFCRVQIREIRQSTRFI